MFKTLQIFKINQNLIYILKLSIKSPLCKGFFLLKLKFSLNVHLAMLLTLAKTLENLLGLKLVPNDHLE